jgi:gamma-glutamyltranspeptidase
MAQTISAEIMEKGGLVSLEDLNKYETTVHDTPLESESLPGDLIVCGPPPPSSFAATQAIINVMAELYKNETIMDLNDPLIYHRLIEAEKFAYAERTKLVSESATLKYSLF